jgi:hypothetical protein
VIPDIQVEAIKVLRSRFGFDVLERNSDGLEMVRLVPR